MSTRYITNIGLMLAGGLVLVATQAFGAGITADLVFAVGIGLVSVLMTVQLDRSRGPVQRGLDAVAGVLAAWAVIASVFFAAPLGTWLAFAEALGFIVLGLVGLTLHELRTERVVHSLTLAPDARRREAA